MTLTRQQLAILLVGGGIVAGLAFGLFLYFQAAAAQQTMLLVPKQRVVIATADIPPHTEIAASMVAVRVVPDELVQVGSARRVEDVVGKVAPDPILKGAVINTQSIGAVAAKNAPSYKIEKGKVMYPLPINLGTGQPFLIARVNAIRPGDRVDLIYSTINAPLGLTAQQRDDIQSNPVSYLQTRILLQDLRVQDMGVYAPSGNLIPQSGPNANVIFIVPPEQALVLKWLKDATLYYAKGASLEMILRSPADEEQTDQNTVINYNYMREKYNLAPAPSIDATRPGAATRR